METVVLLDMVKRIKAESIFEKLNREHRLNTYHVDMGTKRRLSVNTGDNSWPTIQANVGRGSVNIYTIFGKALDTSSRDVDLSKIGGKEDAIVSVTPHDGSTRGFDIVFASNYEQADFITASTLTLTAYDT